MSSSVFPLFFSLHHTHTKKSQSERTLARLLDRRTGSTAALAASLPTEKLPGALSPLHKKRRQQHHFWASAASSSSSRRLRQLPQRLLRPCLPTLTSPRWLSSRGTAERPRASRQRGAWRSSTCSGRRWRVRGEQRVFPLIFLHPLFLLLLLVYRLSLLLSSSPSPTASRPL